MTVSHATIGPYRLVRKLGEGGMGAVYEALHETIERRVAIKLLRPEYARDADITKRFFNEARAVNRIEHASLIQISDYGHLPDGTAYIVMEYLNGETLGQRLQRLHGWLPLHDALRVAWQIAAALAAVHDKGITHRDLKPENVMLVADPMIPGGERVKLLDFGIAKLAQDTKATQVRTRSDVIMGTPTYMSPEQCRGAGMVDAKSDVYSLGVMLYQMLAGRPPFIGEGSGELIGMHLFREPLPLAELAPQTPTALTALVHELLTKDRDARPAMRLVVTELERLQAQHQPAPARGIPGSAAAPIANSHLPTALPAQHSTLGRSAGQRRRLATLRRPRLVLAALLGGGATALLLWSLRPTHPVPPPPRPAAAAPAPARVPEPPAAREADSSEQLAASHAPGSEPPAGSEPPSREKVIWSIDTIPAGATIVRLDSGKVLGRTPWRSEQDKAAGTLAVRLRAPGFADKLLRLDSSHSGTWQGHLQHLPTPSARAARPIGAQPTPSPAAAAKPVPERPSNAPAKSKFKLLD